MFYFQFEYKTYFEPLCGYILYIMHRNNLTTIISSMFIIYDTDTVFIIRSLHIVSLCLFYSKKQLCFFYSMCFVCLEKQRFRICHST